MLFYSHICVPKNNHKTPKKYQAFTLLELCIVILIVSVIAVLSLPSYRYLLDVSQQQVAQAEILRMIQLAQKTALAKHLPVIICKSKDYLHCNGSWQDGEIVVVHTEAADAAIDPQQIIYSELPRHILHWRSYPRYRNYIMFMPEGLLASDNASFWYCRDVQSAPAFAIVLSKSGRTRVLHPDHEGHIRVKDNQRDLSC